MRLKFPPPACTHDLRRSRHWSIAALCMYYFVYIACMCSTVTWWGGPGGIEAYP